ncbi:MAG TPA: DUF1259 domain-containing protein [Gemmatimonadaceae bacterium]|nr:DUF1259 domain-containing protein [Gemmatimonadaceae bacterium]
MVPLRTRTIAFLGLVAVISVPRTAVSSQDSASWLPIEQALGRTGAVQPGGVMKFAFPRRDLHVMVGNVAVRPALALGGWVAFKQVSGGMTMAMGDLVLTEDEIGPVISALQQGGIEQTALHNHLLGGVPNTMYLHIVARGNGVDIARALRRALEASKTPLDTAAAAAAPALDLDTTAIAKALGYHGHASGGVYQVAVPRDGRIMEGTEDVPASMGTATSINFQSTGGGKAAITGDFVLTGNEVNPVIRVLRDNGIAITALHSHMIGDTPHLYFMHYWANDDALKLARALGAALAKTQSARPNGTS